MLSARNIQQRRILFDNYRLIPDAAFEQEHQRTQAAPHDILLTIVGTIGRVAIVQEDTPEFTLQRSVAVLKPNTSLAPRFLAYALETPRIQKHLTDNAKGTAQKGIYLKALGSLEMEVAPLNEQKRIADKLDTVLARVDACRDHLDRIPAILKRFRQSVLAAATSGKLTEAWRVEMNLPDPIITSLGEWCDVLGGKRLPKGFELTNADTGYPYVRVTDFAGFSVKVAQLRFVPSEAAEVIKRYIINSDDVYISIAGTIGLVGQVPSAISGSNLTENAARIVVREGFVPRFLMYQLGAPAAQDQMEQKKKATTQDKLGLFRIKELELLMPTVDEQTEIVRRVEALFACADRLEARYIAARAQVEKLTPATLAKAFRGKLVPQDPNDESAVDLLRRIRDEIASGSGDSSTPKRRKPEHGISATLKASAKIKDDPMKKQDLVKLEDIVPNHLANILRTFQRQEAKALWAESKLSIDDFYVQLNREISGGLVRVSADDESWLELTSASAAKD